MDNISNNLYLCIKKSNDQYIPFFNIKGSFFSKIQENPKGGSGSVSIDEILQHVNYKEVLENDKNKEPALDNSSVGGAKNDQQIEFEISKNNLEESALPEDFNNYLKYKLNK